MMTEIIAINPANPQADRIRRAARIIKQGGTVAFPTETVYGLGANAFDQRACESIFKIKKRPADNPLIVHICSMKQLHDVAEGVGEEILKSARLFWPGPVTLILKKTDAICDAATAGLKTVAVRMPAHPIALKLIEASGVPIAAPSANLSTKPSPTKVDHVLQDLDGKVDMIIDGGDTEFGVESTIIDMTKRPFVLLRPGAFTVEEIEKHIGGIRIPKGINKQLNSGIAIAPGMKYRHYAPKKKLIAVEGRALFLNGVKNLSEQGKIAVLCSNETADRLECKNLEIIRLGSEKNPYEIAKRLFDSFRLLDKTDAGMGIIQTFPERGIGLALMNRITKASYAYVRSEAELKRLQNLIT